MKEIFHRISVRKYEEREVEEEKIDKILRAGMAAPSARNQQPWEFYVVTNREKLVELSKSTPYCSFTAGAAAAIVTVYREKSSAPDYAHIDMSACMENMLLEADGLGLGGTWMGIAPIPERMEKVERILDIPTTLRAFAIYAFGYPAESREQENRYDPSRVHWVK